MRTLHLLALGLLVPSLFGSELKTPSIERIYPLGGTRAADVPVEILGAYLSNVTTVEFDCEDLLWVETTEAQSTQITGIVRIAPDAALGPHLFKVLTLDGPSGSALFNVGQYPDVRDTEPNSTPATAQKVPQLPANIQGLFESRADIDFYEIDVGAGERWLFDLRSNEYGSTIEAKMAIHDASGRRIVFSEDRNDFNDAPLIDHTFEKAGKYLIEIDRYRGPRGHNFGKNAGYILQIAGLPDVKFLSRLGAQAGEKTAVTIHGNAMDAAGAVYLTEARAGQYPRMTYPYTMPIRFRPDHPGASQIPRIEGEILRRAAGSIEAQFEIPGNADTGLWKLWLRTPEGVAGGLPFEITRLPEYAESALPDRGPAGTGYVINGTLAKRGEKDAFQVQGRKGEPLHFSTLVYQLSVPNLDPVLTLKSKSGEKLAENDDVVTGAGPLLGNADSSLFYTPDEDGPLFLEIKDRILRGGPDFVYRIKVDGRRPGFQLFTTPENFTVARGDSATFEVHMAREEGFDAAVSVWLEGLPAGSEVPEKQIRSDQLFEPGADGVAMVIPEVAFEIDVPETVPTGTYPVRVFGVDSSADSGAGARPVEATTNLLMGPLRDLWNFVRRPVPQITMTVVEPPPAELSAKPASIELSGGGSATLAIEADGVPSVTPIEVRGLPEGVSYDLKPGEGGQWTVELAASSNADPDRYGFSVEANVDGRWVMSETLKLTVEEGELTYELPVR